MKKQRRKLFSPEREELILSELGKEAKSLDELASRLGVSPATVRRDLLSLERKGRIRRVHGGAIRADLMKAEPLFSEKRLIRESEKIIIAELASALVEDGDSIYLDGGSTVLGLCRHLLSKKNLSITTNSLVAASELMESGRDLYLVGGKFRPLSRTIVGGLTAKTIETMHFDKAFLGTLGLTADGISTTDPDEAYTKEIVMGRSKRVILLADSGKFGEASFARSGTLDGIDAIVTDREPDAKFAGLLRKHKIQIICPAQDGKPRMK